MLGGIWMYTWAPSSNARTGRHGTSGPRILYEKLRAAGSADLRLATTTPSLPFAFSTPAWLDRKVGSDAGRLRLDRHMRNRVPGIAGGGRCGLPAFGVAHHDIGDGFP